MDKLATLTRFAWLSIAAAVATIGMKAGAYAFSGSVGLLSGALESVVNLVAAIVALVALAVAAREPDEEHAYGHEKAEYFASGTEGGLILLAAAIASLINLGVALRLRRAAREYRSITLEADARHFKTDVWSSAGVVVAVAGNIVWSGVGLLRRSLHGLLDTALPADEREAIVGILRRHHRDFGVQFHALRTREAGTRRFVSVHVLVPGSWTVHRGHTLLEALEGDIRRALPGVTASPTWSRSTIPRPGRIRSSIGRSVTTRRPRGVAHSCSALPGGPRALAVAVQRG